MSLLILLENSDRISIEREEIFPLEDKLFSSKSYPYTNRHTREAHNDYVCHQ